MGVGVIPSACLRPPKDATAPGFGGEPSWRGGAASRLRLACAGSSLAAPLAIRRNTGGCDPVAPSLSPRRRRWPRRSAGPVAAGPVLAPDCADEATAPTSPSPRRLLAQAAVCAAGLVADPCMQVVDAYFVGLAGVLPLAALGPCGTVVGFAQTLFACSVAASTTRTVAAALARAEADTARLRAGAPTYAVAGAGDGSASAAAAAAAAVALHPSEHHVQRALAAALAVTLAFALAVAALLVASPETWLGLAGAAPELLPHALPYFRVRAVSLVPAAACLVLQAAYHARLDLITPVRAILVGAAVNAVLDPLLIYGLGWGPAGAAAATLAAASAQACFLVRRVLTVDRAAFMDARPGQVATTRLAVIEFAGETAILSVRAVNVVAVWGSSGAAAARLGVVATAGHHAVLSIASTAINGMGAWTTVATAVASRAMAAPRGGAGPALAAGTTALRLALVVSTSVSAVLLLLGEAWPAIVTRDPAVLAAVAPVAPVAGLMTSLTWFKAVEGTLVGLGDSVFVSLLFLPSAGVCLAGLGVAARSGAGLVGIWCALLGYCE